MDVLVALLLPAMAIFALVFGPQRTWIILLLLGVFEFAAAFSVLRRNSRAVASSGAIRQRELEALN